MKLAVICFHKNIHQVYLDKWILQFKNSILNQTHKDFTVIELNYGGGKERIFENSIFESKKLANHAESHNYLLDKSFELGFDYVANVNCDDFYSIDRFRVQLKYLQAGYDIVSSNFTRINENDKIISKHIMSTKNFIFEANKNHNIIAHPVCMYSKRFWESGLKLISSEIPKDDFEMWKRAYAKGLKLIVTKEFLLCQRIHSNNVSRK